MGEIVSILGGLGLLGEDDAGADYLRPFPREALGFPAGLGGGLQGQSIERRAVVLVAERAVKRRDLGLVKGLYPGDEESGGDPRAPAGSPALGLNDEVVPFVGEAGLHHPHSPRSRERDSMISGTGAMTSLSVM